MFLLGRVAISGQKRVWLYLLKDSRSQIHICNCTESLFVGLEALGQSGVEVFSISFNAESSFVLFRRSLGEKMVSKMNLFVFCSQHP